MTQIVDTTAPVYRTLALTRRDRLLVITLNQPESLNAVDLAMHEELAEVFTFAAADAASDVVLLTGAGKAFSAGGNLDHIANNAANPEQFIEEVRLARRIVFAMIDLDKPLVCRMNGHAVGLGATLALLCDVVFAAENAKIGDPHVALGLVAGDGGAVIWPQLVGLARAKEYLLTGELLTATRAAELGLINHCLPPGELDSSVDAFCDKLLAGATQATRWTKVLLNMELKRVATTVMDAGIAYEALSQRSPEHLEGLRALQEKRQPDFRKLRDNGAGTAGRNETVARYRLIVLASPMPGREQECADWYQNIHLPEMVTVSGVVAAQRYQRAADLRPGADTWPYMTVYEVETDDVQSVIRRIIDRASAGGFTMSDALDREDTYAVFYEACGPEVSSSRQV